MTRRLVDPANTWLPNLRWSMADIDEITRFARLGWDVASIAVLYFCTPEDMQACCDRNGIVLRGSRRIREDVDA